jgi:hypothetical protein
VSSDVERRGPLPETVADRRADLAAPGIVAVVELDADERMRAVALGEVPLRETAVVEDARMEDDARVEASAHGEEFVAAALREVREETGLAASALQRLGGFAYIREPWGEAPRNRLHVEAFIVDVEPTWEPQVNEEHDEYRRLPREEAAELLFRPEPAALLRSLP